eukprot:m.33208 g.33208  ORF g.33208 m.33208 type:complete len:99 (+) comp31769_c0_seq7:750-1046(+)
MTFHFRLPLMQEQSMRTLRIRLKCVKGRKTREAVMLIMGYFWQVEQALVVVAYSTGEQANAHWMPRGVCEAYWDEWLKRLDEYRRLDGFSDDFDSTTL